MSVAPKVGYTYLTPTFGDRAIKWRNIYSQLSANEGVKWLTYKYQIYKYKIYSGLRPHPLPTGEVPSVVNGFYLCYLSARYAHHFVHSVPHSASRSIPYCVPGRHMIENILNTFILESSRIDWELFF